MRYDDYQPGGFSLMPPAIKALIISNVLIALLSWLLPDLNYALREYGALWPVSSSNFEIWQPISYLFLHGGFGHLFFNMLALWMFGVEIENYWGTKHFTSYYFACGVGAGILNMIFTHDAPTIGASGAVYGVLLAFGMMFPDRNIYIYFLIPIKAKYLVAIYAVLEFFASLGNSGSNVAHFAHLGGMLIGFVYIKVMQGELPMQGWLEKTFTAKQNYTQPTRSSSTHIKQDRIDEILDKISRTGYESLTNEEKRELLEASKRQD
ncbi:MAG: rhomboid family intramembrane serine protease [Chlorobiales bacterium]